MKKILLVDDERIFHFLSAKMFEISGIPCEIHSAYDGKDALALITAGLRPDYIFLDLEMPTVNGFKFLEAFKKLNLEGIRIVVLSSHVMEEERNQAIALGADVYMGKPLSENDVRNLIGG